MNQLLQKFNEMREQIFQQFADLQIRLDKMSEKTDKRFAKQDKRFDRIEKTLSGHDEMFELIVNKLIMHDDKFDQMHRDMVHRDEFNTFVTRFDAMLVLFRKRDLETVAIAHNQSLLENRVTVLENKCN
ncbi:MAG: hypothetical protein WCT18_00040 [Patescibacteria group bacterium]